MVFGLFKYLGDELKGIFVFLASVIGIIVILYFCFLFKNQILRHTISVGTISVPKTLAERGYTERVAAARLRDAIWRVVEHVQNSTAVGTNDTTRVRPLLTLNKLDIPDIIVPGLILPSQLIARSINSYFGVEFWHNISGEFVVYKDKLSLRLRVDGTEFYVDRDGVDINNPDVALGRAVQPILIKTAPYVAIIVQMQTDRAGAQKTAISVVDKFSQNSEDVPWSLNLLGVLSFKDNKLEDAELWFKRALESAESFQRLLDKRLPSSTSLREFIIDSSWDRLTAVIHNNLGVVYHKLGRLSDSTAEIDTALWEYPSHRFAHYNKCQALYTAEDRDAALLECSLAFRADKKLAFRRTAKPDSKLEELTVESRGPNDLDHGDAAVLLLEGIEAVKDNDLTCAVVHYRSAIQLDRKYAHAHKNLGDVLRKLDKRDDALAEYDQAVALDPAYAYAYNSRGLLLFEAGNMADSASAFAKAVERAPNVPVFHNNLALTFARAGMTNDAFNAYIDMEKKWPSDALTHLRLGKLFEDRGELTIAKEQYKLVSESSSPTYASSPDSAEVIDLADLFAEPHLRLGKILLQEKKQDEALVEFQNVLNRPFRTGFDTEVSLHIARITIALLPTDDNSQRYVNSLVEACNTLIYGSKGASADFSEFVDLSGQVDRLFRGRDHCNLPRPVTEIAEKVPPTTPSGRPPSDGVPSECKTGDPSPVRSKSRLPVGPPRPINPW